MPWNTAIAAGPNSGVILAELGGWVYGPDHTRGQVAANLRAETALPDAEFQALLEAFAAELANGTDGGLAFETACRSLKLRGPAVRGVMPTVLGRATTMRRLCGWFHDRHPSVTQEKFEQLVRLHASPVSRPSTRLRKAPLGRHVVWATFRNPDRDQSPFTAPLATKEDVITALGLGDQSAHGTWVMLVYRPRCQRAELRLPTVADAGMYSYFRPVADVSTAEHGLTQPLPPNPKGLGPQPEIVHGDAVSYDIALPLLVWD
jgi:hypothetical protein